jgi:heat shock protein HtpX
MSIGLQSEIWNNNVRSVFLLALYPLIIFGMVWAGAYVFAHSQGGYQMVRTDNAFDTTWTNVGNPEYVANNILFEYWPIIAAVIGGWFLISYLFNDMLIRADSGARAISRKEEPELYNLLENLCIAEGMSMPRLNIIETPALNAFASGVDARSYAVTVTRGLMQALSKDELEAVLGHELAHILNRDVRLLMVAVVFTGMIGFMAQIAWRSLRYNMVVPRSRNNKGGGILFLMAIGVILWIGYMLTIFTRFAISRRREYMADAGSVQMTKNPDAMMRALMKISGNSHIRETTDDIRMMCIENDRAFMGLFATHPPIKLRIQAISKLTNTPVPV